MTPHCSPPASCNRCSKSGKHRETRTTETRRRKAHSSKTDCPFNIYAHRIDPISNKFTFDIKSGDHNHLPDFERFRTRPIRRKVRSTPFRIEPEPQVVESDEVKKVKKVRGKGKRKAGKGNAAGEPGEENAAVGGPMDHGMEFEPHVTPLHPSQHPDFGLLEAHHSHHQSAHHDPHHMGTGMDDDVNVDYGLDGTTLADMGERMEREQQMADEAEREGEEGERRHHPHHHGEDGEDHPHYHSHQSGQNGYAPGQAGYEQQHHEDATHHHHYEPESDVLDPVFQTAVGDEPEGGSNGVSDMRTKNGYEDPAGDAVAVADMANHEAMELGGMMGIGEMGQYQHPVEGVEGERYGEYEAGREHDAGQVVEALEHEEGGDGSATGAGDERQGERRVGSSLGISWLLMRCSPGRQNGMGRRGIEIAARRADSRWKMAHMTGLRIMAIDAKHKSCIVEIQMIPTTEQSIGRQPFVPDESRSFGFQTALDASVILDLRRITVTCMRSDR